MSEWIPVTERLPEKNKEYLATVENENGTCRGIHIVEFITDGRWWDPVFDQMDEHITAWMPLPEPYKA